MRKKIFTFFLTLTAATSLCAGCKASQAYSTISATDFWNGLCAQGYSSAYDRTDSYREVNPNTERYDDISYYYDGTTEFIFSDFTGNAEAAYFYDTVTESYSQMTDTEKSSSIGSTEKWSGTNKTDNLSIVSFRVEDVVVTATGTYEQAEELKTVVENLFMQEYGDIPVQTGETDVNRQENITGNKQENTAAEDDSGDTGEILNPLPLQVGGYGVNITGSAGWEITSADEYLVSATVGDRVVSYMDSFVGTADDDMAVDSILAYGYTEDDIMVFTVNNRTVYAGMKDDGNGIIQTVILQDIGVSTFLEIHVTDASGNTNLQSVVSEFALNL